MTDIYVSYAREDRENVRRLGELLGHEGWDVWLDPAEGSSSNSAELDVKLASASAILVVWSGYSRGSETVRSEAATGLYKNKLVQVKIDPASPPRPFDQVEVSDLSRWSGDREDMSLRKVISALRLLAGLPQSVRPHRRQQADRAPNVEQRHQSVERLHSYERPQRPQRPERVERPAPPERPLPPPRGIDFDHSLDFDRPSEVQRLNPQASRRESSSRSYREPKRSGVLGPLLAFGVVAAAGAGVWYVDPLGWRSGESVASAPEATQVASLENASTSTAAAGVEDTAESAASWTRVNRDSVVALRDYVADYPRSSNAETARSLLRVRDAQSWVKAVTTDNDSAYQAYLTEFPAKGVVPGAMAAAATERLSSLSSERALAIRDIQSGLSALSIYDGAIDGQGSEETVRAVKLFASEGRKPAPALLTAAPRDLRTFADAIQKAAGARSTKAPIIAATATTTNAANAAAEADRQRVAEAQAAAKVATQSAAATVAAVDADALALGQQDAAAWASAERTATAAGYQSYLAAYPTGAQASTARTALAAINKKQSAFSLDQISGEVKAAAEAARRAQASANGRASQARDAATAAAGATGLRSIVAANGDQYEAQIAGGAPNGLGVRVSGSAANAGDRYRGELRDGLSSGLGVYEFGSNPNNTGGAARYEGEHTRGGASGYGVTYWKNGDNFAGQETSGNGQSRGVFTFANGQKYEGEMRDGTRNGFGVVWGPDGTLMAAGRWANGELVEPMKAGQ